MKNKITSKYNHKECEGCNIYEKLKSYNTQHCQIINYGDAKHCPCRNCIIKTTCSKTCEKFLNWDK